MTQCSKQVTDNQG